MGLVGVDRHRPVRHELVVGAAELAEGSYGLRLMGDVMGRLFQSQRRAMHAILEGIRDAKRTILVQAYLLYSRRLAGALVRVHQRGVQVHVLIDATAQPHDPPVPAVARLVAAGIAVSPDAQHA
jgi:phosphatidylserine/phosphatidylglycerophosphate/cardiolipin synthase-like enzyme